MGVLIMNLIQKYILMCLAWLTMLSLSLSVYAVSLVDFTDVAIVQTASDLKDTGTAALTWVLPIVIFILALALAPRLVKRFGRSI